MTNGVVYYWEDGEGLLSYVCAASGKHFSIGTNMPDVKNIISRLECSFGHAGFEFQLITKEQSHHIFESNQ